MLCCRQKDDALAAIEGDQLGNGRLVKPAALLDPVLDLAGILDQAERAPGGYMLAPAQISRTPKRVAARAMRNCSPV